MADGDGGVMTKSSSVSPFQRDVSRWVWSESGAGVDGKPMEGIKHRGELVSMAERGVTESLPKKEMSAGSKGGGEAKFLCQVCGSRQRRTVKPGAGSELEWGLST